RNRMKSVNNIQKITKAMKMVAASKLQAIHSRGLWQPFTALLGDSITVDVKKNVIVTVSSDKCLCGGINSTSVKVSQIVEREAASWGLLGALDSYEIEGGDTKAEVLMNLTEFQFSCTLFNAVLESACSEQGARMSAMDSSSRNAGDMLDRPTFSYNRTRQASIATELIEIISGAISIDRLILQAAVCPPERM
ncbi:hypothetical protein MKW92_041142, partial [Papaver armeniacum]